MTIPYQASDSTVRNLHLDVLRGLALIFVVMGHIDPIPIGYSAISYLYTFHIPIFFVISGMLFNKTSEIKSFILGKFRSIYIPYLLYFLISIIFGNIVVKYFFGQYVIPFDLLETIKAFLYSSEWLNHVPTFNFALWFLPIFFISNIFFWPISKIKSQLVLYAFLPVLGIASVFFQDLVPGRPILSINALFPALFFMLAGYCAKNALQKFQFKPLITFILFLGSLVMAYNYPGNIQNIGSFVFLISALISFSFYFVITKALVYSKLLRYIGFNGLHFFALHSLVAYTYQFTGIRQYFESWGGLSIWLINLIYVVMTTVFVIYVFKSLSHLHKRFVN